MKLTPKLAWLLLVAFIINACASPIPNTQAVPTNSPLATPTATLHITKTARPHSSPESLQHATPFKPVTFSSNLDPDQIHVDVGISYQTIDGFGATHISLVYQGMGSTLTPELHAKAIDAVYHQVGINLGNLEGGLLESSGSYDQRSNDNNDPDEFNWNGFQTFSADAINSNLLTLAEPYGFNGYYIDQHVNLRWASPWLQHIRSADYPLYLKEVSEQVAAGNIYWRDNYGIVPRYIMLFNEPFGGNGELQSQNGNTQEVVDLVKAVGSRLESEGFSNVRFVLPNDETVSQSLNIARSVLSDPDARKYVGVIGYHSYPYDSSYASIPNLLRTSGTGLPDPDSVMARNQLLQLSQQYNVPVWMTEVSHGAVDPISYDDFRGRAIHIHDELVFANVSAYFGMNNMWDTVSQEEHFGNGNLFDYSNEGNIVLIDNDQQKVYITGMGYAIGQYAHWVKPGAVRVEGQTGDPLVQVTAFKSPDSTQLIMILINNRTDSKNIHVNINGAKLVGNVSGEQSTTSQYWAVLDEFQVSTANSFQVTLPGESVTTLVIPLEQS